jgi:HEAT repeat protein
LGAVSCSCYLHADSFEESIAQKVYAHLLIKDIDMACDEARRGVEQYPDSVLLQEMLIKALAHKGNHKLIAKAWQRYAGQCEVPWKNREVLEEMAWGIINHGSNSESPLIRICALLGAFFGEDAKGVSIVVRLMQDHNSLVRATAVKIAGRLRDKPVCDAVMHLLKHEKNWHVRMEAIQTAGRMQIRQAAPQLMSILDDAHARLEEKIVAQAALVEMWDKVERKEIASLISSNRAGLKLLASELVEVFALKEDADLLLPLLQDGHPTVRAAAIHAIGVLRIDTIKEQSVATLLKPLLSDSNTDVGITAAWAFTMLRPEEGALFFNKWLRSEIQDERWMAAAALSATGKYGEPYIRKIIDRQKDPFVRMNLALGLLAQRSCVDQACEILYQGCISQDEKWSWENYPFDCLTPKRSEEDPAIPNFPEVANQLARMEILNMLAIMQYPFAQQAIRNFLGKKIWGITGTASALLLTEGDDSAIDLVQGLLSDADPQISSQAALILALWGKKEEAVAKLQDLYPEADRELKEKILEGMGRIGAKASIPFLVNQLQNPYESLRLIAASSLLQCLYH